MEQRFETFTVLVAKLSRLIRKIKGEEVAEYNLKSVHVSCLYAMYRQNRNLTATELCEACDEDKGAISRSIEFLEGQGYIACESKSEKRYKSPLMLTEKGREVGEKIAQKIDFFLEKASEGLEEEERKVLYKSLMLVSDNLQKICERYGD